MVYPLAKLRGEHTRLSPQELEILHAAAILHDIAIKYCKEHHYGDASQEKQKREAPRLVRSFLSEANYPPSYVPRIIELVERHHDYDCPRDSALQLLIEAD